jgi:hypothetical protein
VAGSSVPGSLGTDTRIPTIDAGTLARAPTPPPGVVGATGTGTKFNIDDAVKHLDSNAYPKSQGACARYVREAIEAGGVTISFPRPLYAKDYGPKLTELGFSKLDAKDYVPKKGDVVVVQPPAGQSAGHIQMYNGKTWVSDFVQGEDIYPGPAFRKEKVAYEIYRP